MRRLPRSALRHSVKISMAHAALCHDRVGESLNLADAAAKYRNLQAIVVIEVDVKRRYRQFVVVVLVARQPLGEVTRPMFVDISEHRDASLPCAALSCLFDLSQANEVTDSFGTARVAAPTAKLVKRVEEIVVDGDRDALHDKTLEPQTTR